MEKAWFYEILILQVVLVMVRDKKRSTIKDTMPIKVNFIHYRNCITQTRVKLAVVFEEFDMVYNFGLLFYFHCHCQLVKGQPQQKTGEGAAASPPAPVSTGLMLQLFQFLQTYSKVISNPCNTGINAVLRKLISY